MQIKKDLNDEYREHLNSIEDKNYDKIIKSELKNGGKKKHKKKRKVKAI